MTLLDRFNGRGIPKPGGEPVANPLLTEPPALQLLFAMPPGLDADAIALAVRAFHPDLAQATAELFTPESEIPDAGEAFGLVGWDRHVIKLMAIDSSMPAEAVAVGVGPAHFAAEIKQAAYAHQAHVLLSYAGYEPDPLERYVALAATASALVRFGAVVVMNEYARTAVPAAGLLPDPDATEDPLDGLRGLPIPLLYAGFVKLEVADDPGVWMRTYGGARLSLPDLAHRSSGPEEGAFVFHLFSNMLAYLRESDRTFIPGDTVRAGDDLVLQFRSPQPTEWFLESDGELLVAEPVEADLE